MSTDPLITIGRRRSRHVRELARAEDELRALIVEGAREGANIADMCRRAGISRMTAFRWLKQAGQ